MPAMIDPQRPYAVVQPFLVIILVIALLLAGSGQAAARIPAPAASPDECSANIGVSSASDSGGGTLRQAIEDLCDGGTITFETDYTIFLDSSLTLSRTLTIDGGNHTITLSGDSGNDHTRNVRPLYLESTAVVTLMAVRVVSGTEQHGGAIYNNGTLTISDSIFSANFASGSDPRGGAIYNNGTLTISDTAFNGNTATRGGGIFNGNGRTLSVSGGTFSGNTAALFGGGIYHGSGTASVIQSTFDSNTSTGDDAGAIYIGINGTTTISQSSFINNTANASAGGALFITGYTTISQSSFIGSSAVEGGAIYTNNSASSVVTMTNTTITNSNTSSSGALRNGGIFSVQNSTITNSSGASGEGLSNVGTLHLINTLIASSSGADCINTITIATNLNNLIEDGTCNPAFSGAPLLTELGNYGGATQTYALQPGSPAIDAGDAASCPTVDQRNVARPQGAGCDIGAFESRGFRLNLISGNGQQAELGTAFDAPLTVQLAAEDSGVSIGSGHTITFTGPLDGASISPNPVTASTDTGGTASTSVTANPTVGYYSVTASGPEATSATFSLQNCILSTSIVSSASDSGAGSLRQAVSDACDGSSITFDDDYTIYLDSNIEITKSLTIDGSGHDVIISGDSGNDGSRNIRPLTANSAGGITLTHLSVVSGTNSHGAGIYNWERLTLIDVTVYDNYGMGTNQRGGGIYNNGRLTIDHSTIISNGSNLGGGIYVNDGDTLTVTNSLITQNSSTNAGGGIRSFGPVTVSDTSITNNSATSSGGGIYVSAAQATLTRLVITGNTAKTDGGGILINTSGKLTLSNSTISSNTASTGFGGGASLGTGTHTISNSVFSQNSSTRGGGIYTSATFNMTNSTLVDNRAPYGGGLYSSSGTTTFNHVTLSGSTVYTTTSAAIHNSGALTLSNSLIANTIGAPDCLSSNTINLQSVLIEDGSCSATLSGDPKLAALGDYGGETATLALLPGSPALDAGHVASCAATDQRGVARPQGSGCDLGAYESLGFTLSAVSGGGQQANAGAAFAAPLVVQLSAVDAGVEVGAGHVITFSAPLSGASLSTTTITATTDATGVASATVSANTTAGSYTVTATAPSVSTPVSFALSQYAPQQLSVSIVGQGSVSSSPAGIACGSTCSALFDPSTVVTLTATPAEDWSFAAWSGACSGTEACVVTLDQARSVTATFEQDRRSVFLPLVSR